MATKRVWFIPCKNNEIAWAETTGGRTVYETKLSLRQIHFILWKWDLISALTHYPVAVGSVWFWDVPQTLQIVIFHFHQHQMLWHRDTASSSLLFSCLLCDTFNIALIYIFSIIPPCGAAHDNDHVVKWAVVPMPTSHVGTGTQGLPVGRAKRMHGSITIVIYVSGSVGG